MKDINILLVEDNEGDIVLTTEELFDAKIINKLTVVRDGEEALNFLDHIAAQDPSLLPDLILLDINLPRINGQEMLIEIKRNPRLRNITVVMLTTSSSELDRKESYNSEANFFITKPFDFNKLFGIIKKVPDFYISVVKQPS